jgi:hypothetical protein
LLLGMALTLPVRVPNTPQNEDNIPVSPTFQPVVLLELFTSQGCSSCPPADRVLQRLNADALAGKLPVIALSFHVDYWNRLGWADPYSQAAFSDRQRSYARHLNGQGVYTPQLVVQGSSGHVGSREQDIREAIAGQRNHPAATTISGQWVEAANSADELTLQYHLDGRSEGINLCVALVETTVANDVPRGETKAATWSTPMWCGISNRWQPPLPRVP